MRLRTRPPLLTYLLFEGVEHLVHQLLEQRGGVGDAKGHDQPSEHPSVWCPKGHQLLGTLRQIDLPEP